MKRSLQFLAASTVGLATLAAAAPAFAQYSGDGSAAAGGVAALFSLVCVGIFVIIGLALVVLNIWMFIDALGRQEWEFGNNGSKTLWLVLLGVGFFFSFGWIVALVYYFLIYRKIKRGSVPPTGYAPPAGPGYGAPPPPPAGAGYSPPPPAPPGQGYAPPPPPPAPPAPAEQPTPPASETPAPPAPGQEPPAPPAPPSPGE
jgi:hypothetical protein